MLRSSSSTRVSDDFLSHSSPSLPSLSQNHNRASSDTSDQLPTYNPQSQIAKRERNRHRFAESAIHLIPILLVFCAIILWFFSNPVDLVNMADSNVARIERLTLSNNNISSIGAKSSVLSNSKMVEDFDATNRSTDPEHIGIKDSSK